jgi:nucleoside permease NupC
MSKLTKSPRIQTFAQDKATNQSEYECVTTLAKAFQKEVEEPITIRETLMKNSELQRCMLHNIIFSVYCTVCRKVLCASCMYTSTLHRKHRVVPLEAATDELREDLRNF